MQNKKLFLFSLPSGSTLFKGTPYSWKNIKKADLFDFF